ncbi:MAG: hypothetical protein IPJ14_09730 [Kineosporiaceae bacterium]|nr:hypothetical protein [Kineosporiaceae bacterium]MBK7622925.1 hypothetical protein [Kineosporiaceae bacterium]
MSRDPFGLRQTLVELAVTVLIVSFCLHWAVQLLAEVWPWLVGLGGGVVMLGIGWRVLQYRRDRW